MAEHYTQRILKTSLILHEKEKDEKKKQSKLRQGLISGKNDPRGSKRRR